jgi:ATP-dependent DNA helicase RecG
MHQALPTAKLLEESIPETIRTKYKLPSIADCITQLHFPDNGDTITHAQRRLAFEEGLVQQLAVELHKQALRKLAAPSIPKEEEYQLRELESKLPFNLTRGQQDALLSIFHDLQYKHPMNRLLQGDVGSGKTIVALLAARAVTAAGYQVALLAPTEILAKQHYDSLLNQLEILGIKKEKVGLLTRNFRYIANTPVTKKQFLEHVQDVSDLLIIGTHALLQEEATFSNLGLVIIDEQHRFGIAQRQALIAPTKAKHSTKRQKNRRYPHLLSMSATPIPRTAALALFGDLEISTIQELPKKRLPIKTWLVPEEKRTGAYGFIKTQIAQGRQAFIITPLVEDSASQQTKAAKTEFLRLKQSIFPEYRLDLLYGSMKGPDKDAVMLKFKQQQTDILVATSVIEIGIDFPNANVIIIEDADKFGLAQLHQLRGRVGRGTEQSYCFLFSNTETSHERLELFAKTRDGFKLATYDLATRGFGSLFGNTNQTGFSFKYGQLLNFEILHTARKAAQELTRSSPSLKKYPLLEYRVRSTLKDIHLE